MTGLQVEQLHGYLARQEPITSRAKVLQGLDSMGDGLAKLLEIKALLDAVVADAAAAAQPEFELAAIQADWGANLRKVVAGDGTAENPGFDYAGKTGLAALAQLLADLSEQAGLEAGANRLRLFKGQAAAETIIGVDQDA